MIVLVSRWELRDGCPPEMKAALEALTTAVKSEEPDTLMFSVSAPAQHPPIGPPPEYAVDHAMSHADLSIPPSEQREVVFFEVYRDAEAFGKHLRGPFADFLTKYRHLFQTPWQGHPRPETIYLDFQSLFVRSALVEPQS